MSVIMLAEVYTPESDPMAGLAERDRGVVSVYAQGKDYHDLVKRRLKRLGRWLLDQQLIREASWEGIKSWAAAHPQRLNELLWVNPRVVFFKEEPLSEVDAMFGPRGAQGVPLTPGRSIAVDRGSMPYGTPVWLSTGGAALSTHRLVMAQDTGGAIVGAARVDFFTGWGSWNDPAITVSAQLKQPVRLWALWPR
jgi:membrane-bound lytic murein transglycosylase A